VCAVVSVDRHTRLNGSSSQSIQSREDADVHVLQVRQRICSAEAMAQ
jgi:hypothetical protein